jgi:FAD/FMN-containing dehydrogenase
MRPVIAHIQVGNWFRVCVALLIREYTKQWDNRMLEKADLMVALDGKMWMEHGVEHYKSRISASYWVKVSELHLLEKDIRDDHVKRGLNSEQLCDIHIIREWIGK